MKNLVLPLWLADILRRILRFNRGVKNRVKIWLRGLDKRNSEKAVVIVLSLDKLGPSREVAKQAFQKGYFVHVFSPAFPVLEAEYAHAWSKVDPRTDFELAERIATALKPTAVLLESKNLLLPMQAYLADSLGLISVGDSAAKTSNSKIALRRAFDKHGVVNLHWILLSEYTEGGFYFPCVLKPDLGTASKGVKYISDHDDLLRNTELGVELKEDPSVGGSLLLEGFVDGRQFDLEGLAVNGEYYLLCVVEEFYEAAPPYFPPAWFFFNPPIEESRLAALWDATQKALRAAGVRNGWHMEQRMDADNRVIMLDYGNRMGYNHLISASSGVDFAGTYVDLMTEVSRTVPKRNPTTLLQLFAFNSEQLAGMKRLARDRPQCVHLQSFRSYEFSFHLYLGTMVVKFDSFAELKAVLREYGLFPDEIGRYYPDDRVRAPFY